MDTATKAAAWLKQHSASERSFARALRKHFGEQAARVAGEAADIHGLTPDMVPLIFNTYDEHAEFMPLVRRNVAGLMLSGARAELQELERRRKPRKSVVDPFDEEYMDEFGLDAPDVTQLFIESIPIAVRAAVRAAIDEAMSQPYWQVIQDGVAADIGDIIKTSLDAGDSPHTMASRIAEQLGGPIARQRSMVIARTETTGALNAGHTASIEATYSDEVDDEDGDDPASGNPSITGKEWLAIGDERTRDSHLSANGQIAARGEPFNIGGHEARYPGDSSLPAEERVSCRCTVVGVIAE